MSGVSNNDGIQFFSVLGDLILENLTVLGRHGGLILARFRMEVLVGPRFKMAMLPLEVRWMFRVGA